MMPKKMRRRGQIQVGQHNHVMRNVETPKTRGISSVLDEPSFSRDTFPAGIRCQISLLLLYSILSHPFSPTLTRAAPTPDPGIQSGNLCRGGDAHRRLVLMLLRERALLSYGLIPLIYMTIIARQRSCKPCCVGTLLMRLQCCVLILVLCSLEKW